MYRSRWQPDQLISLRTATLRWLTLVALIGYPVGALLAALNAEGSLPAILGSLVAPICALAGLIVLMSRTQRITQAKEAELDEFELQLRHRAMGKAYGILTIVVLTGTFYLQMAPDWGSWMPHTEPHWRGIFWGIILYAALLPTATLVWSRELALSALDEEEEESA